MKTAIRLATKACCFIILWLLHSVPSYAQERSLQEVADSAYVFFTNMSNQALSTINTSPFHSWEAVDILPVMRANSTYLYVVNLHAGGWVLVSNEKRYKAILGFGYNGSLDVRSKDVPPALNDLLDHHMNMIDSLRQDGAEEFNRRRALVSSPINRTSNYTPGDSLLVKNGDYIIWDQSYNNDYCYTEDPTDVCCARVYNKFCPTNHNHGCGHTWAGCGAVAMGQLMNYWGWPNQAEIPDTITNNFLCICGIPSDSKHIHYYDWEHMPAKLTTTTDLYAADNIAKLLRDCGYAAQTYYINKGSAAMMEKIDVAMRETFHYHATFVVERSNLDVASMIRSDIDALRPVMSQAWYHLDSIDLPHTFIIDGYNNIGLYHINFGWGGYRNNWFDLGFNGYTVFRNFLTEIYPDCDQLADIYVNPDTTINAGENMVLYAERMCLGGYNHNLTINNGGYLLAEASDSIILIGGFHADNGSSIHLKIRDFCDATGSYIRQMPNRIIGNTNEIEESSLSNEYSTQVLNDAYLIISPNPVNSTLSIQMQEDISQAKIYTINGQCVLQASQTDIDVSALPQGMYILRALTSDGQQHQAKFIKQ